MAGDNGSPRAKSVARALNIVAIGGFALAGVCYFVWVRPGDRSVYQLDGLLRFAFWVPLALGVGTMLAASILNLAANRRRPDVGQSTGATTGENKGEDK